MSEFQEFNKIPRLTRECVVTEKIDGTNAQVFVPEDPAAPLMAGSRTRWITPEADNFGFAAWVRDHADELRALGPGRHFGEWWGAGVQRRYGLDHKRFSLFNTARWVESWRDGQRATLGEKQQYAPECCHVVPVLYTGPFDTRIIEAIVDDLAQYGSRCAPGFMKPEGVVVYHTAANLYFKKTCEKDSEWKGRQAA